MIIIKEIIDSFYQKESPKCGEIIQTKYPSYRNDGSEFVVCENCKNIIEVG